MKIHVEMTSDEFQEFLSWKADKKMYEKDIEKTNKKCEVLHQKVIWAIEPDPKKPEKVKIADQEHAAELLDMANDWFC